MSAPSAIVVEDEWIVAQDIKRILEKAGLRVPAVVVRVEDVANAVQLHRPDLVILDVSLGGATDGIDAARACLTLHPAASFLFVTAFSDAPTLARAKAIGPGGYLVKPFTDAQLRAAVEIALSPRGAVAAARTLEAIRTLLAGDVARPAPPPSRLDVLSARERDVVQALCEGGRVKGIGKTLAISPATVRNHLKSAFAKLGVHSQQELIELLRPRR